MFGVEAGGQCFSGANAGLSFKKHGQAPDGDCTNGAGANFRMSVYEFSKLSLLFFPSLREEDYYSFIYLFIDWLIDLFIYLFQLHRYSKHEQNKLHLFSLAVFIKFII